MVPPSSPSGLWRAQPPLSGTVSLSNRPVGVRPSETVELRLTLELLSDVQLDGQVFAEYFSVTQSLNMTFCRVHV